METLKTDEIQFVKNLKLIAEKQIEIDVLKAKKETDISAKELELNTICAEAETAIQEKENEIITLKTSKK